MDKRSFSFLVTLVAASMVIIGTYKMAKKKSHTTVIPGTHTAKHKVK